jgi:hypothetical protein
MGGMIALELARRMGSKLSALGLVGTTAGDFADPESEQTKTIQKQVADDFRGFARGFATQLFKEHEAAPLYGWAFSQIQKTPGAVASACLASVVAFDARPTLKAGRATRVRSPTSVPYSGEHLRRRQGAELSPSSRADTRRSSGVEPFNRLGSLSPARQASASFEKSGGFSSYGVAQILCRADPLRERVLASRGADLGAGRHQGRPCADRLRRLLFGVRASAGERPGTVGCWTGRTASRVDQWR